MSMDIRLKTAKYTLEGVEYELCCNMNVLADVQEALDGNLLAALDRRKTFQGALMFAAAMVNDAADAQGRSERYTAKQIGRLVPPDETIEFQQMIFNLVNAAIGKKDDGETEQEEQEKN